MRSKIVHMLPSHLLQRCSYVFCCVKMDASSQGNIFNTYFLFMKKNSTCWLIQRFINNVLLNTTVLIYLQDKHGYKFQLQTCGFMVLSSSLLFYYHLYGFMLHHVYFIIYHFAVTTFLPPQNNFFQMLTICNYWLNLQQSHIFLHISN